MDKHFEDIVPYLHAVMDNVPLDDKYKHEKISSTESIKSFATKRMFFVKKVGDSQALRIFERATEEDYIKSKPSEFNKHTRILELEFKGNKLRTNAGWFEEVLGEYGKVASFVFGGTIVTIGAAVIKVVLIIKG